MTAGAVVSGIAKVMNAFSKSTATALATPFYLDMGFTMTDIGVIAKNAGLWASVVGGLLGGLWMVRIGINRGLWLFGIVQLVSILGFAWLAHVHQPDRLLLAFVILFLQARPNGIVSPTAATPASSP